MRPEILFPLFKPLTTLPGVGPRVGAMMEKLLGGDRLLDLLFETFSESEEHPSNYL